MLRVWEAAHGLRLGGPGRWVEEAEPLSVQLAFGMDFAQGVAPREKAIAASLALSLDVEYLPRGMRLRQARTPSKTALECVLG